MADGDDLPYSLRLDNGQYEITLTERDSVLHQCWRWPQSRFFVAENGVEVPCSRMAARAVRRMATRLKLTVEQHRLPVPVEALRCFVALAEVGPTGWSPPKLPGFCLTAEEVQKARSQAIDELRQEYGEGIGEVKVVCSDLGTIPVHEGLAQQLKIVFDNEVEARIPVPEAQLRIIADLIYLGRTSLPASRLAAVFATCTLTTFGEFRKLSEAMFERIIQHPETSLSSEAVRQLNAVSLLAIFTRESFLNLTEDQRIFLGARLVEWACHGQVEGRRNLVDRILARINRTKEPGDVVDYTKFIYYHGHKFDGEYWTLSELHERSRKWNFAYEDAVLNERGDMIVSSRPGPLGVLTADETFNESRKLPHDPLGYGFPLKFDEKPFVCLIFEVYDPARKTHFSELWPWKSGAEFEPIKMARPWDNVGNMVRVNESEFYLTGRKTSRKNSADGGASKVPGDEEDEAGLYRLRLTRGNDGVLRGETELVESWTLDEYSERFDTNFFYVQGALYRQQRSFDFQVGDRFSLRYSIIAIGGANQNRLVPFPEARIDTHNVVTLGSGDSCFRPCRRLPAGARSFVANLDSRRPRVCRGVHTRQLELGQALRLLRVCRRRSGLARPNSRNRIHRRISQLAAS